MEKVFTTHQIGKLCQVDNTTVINWINSSKLPAYKTPGGHRRVKHSELIGFIRKYNMPMPDNLSVSLNKKILIVDDDIRVLKTISRILEKEDIYDYDTATDGFQAGRMLRDCRPDLIILDLMLPGIDGFEVCRMIKSDTKSKQIKIIAVSGHSTPENKKRILSCGADTFLGKPFDKKELINALTKLL
ncbi:response regulator [Elusimicrobiota bacterium]